MPSFGDWLHEQRQVKRLTQEEAAQRAGITRAMWAKLEAGTSGTRRETIPRIALALEANEAETYRMAGFSPPDATETDMELAQYLSGLEKSIPLKERSKFRQLAKRQIDLLASAWSA